ncbi:MAG: AraC family transcriptional regulator [Saprospiraceae bacterium]|nr:AraC family transcriptional regulator [Saprospiraceae bacterium]HMW39077.1 AraC family transcriptional regulator [Saprospiraceae bacterium]HMX87947.1 AraC family transcriptional regulator [Saprospiraceae bacterium]HMZ40003.1 AraC family transcriptional regulator [Saprospiraceae bacterium]HNA65643.1 AraC family transcriptional regulator [Saprospiraceae bacterium]
MQEEYIKRINKVLAFIDDHLDTNLSLQTISKVACYSSFHTHRLFKAITNETLNSYVARKRIERTAILLIHNSKLSIGEIAVRYGFLNDSSYSRSFKKIYGQSPTEFRKANKNNFSKIGKANSKNGKDSFITEEYLCNIDRLKNWIKMKGNIEIKQMPNLNLAYVTQIGEKGIESAFEKIVKWAMPREILSKRNTNVCRVFHDSFKITDADKVRMSIGIASDQEIKVDGEIGLTSIAAGRNIVGHYEIAPEEFEKAWSALFIWMNENGYKKAERNPFEIYHNNYNEHPEKKCIVDLIIPIE